MDETKAEVESKQALWWCAGLLAGILIVSVLALLKLGEIADALGA